MQLRILAVLSAVCTALAVPFSSAAEPIELRIGYTYFAPFVFVDDNGVLKGIDVDLAQAACRRLGCIPHFVPINWHEKKNALQTKAVDCIWTIFTQDGRENEYQWTRPYLRSRQRVVVPETSPIRSLRDLQGRLVATTHGSKAETILLNGQISDTPPQVISFAHLDEAFTSLSEGMVDAAASHESALTYFAKSSVSQWRFLPENLAVVAVGVAFAADADTTFVENLGQTFDELRRDGTLGAILMRYNYDEPFVRAAAPY